MPDFAQPRTVDDTTLFQYPQATPGMKFPLLVEMPSKALLFKILVMPTGQNQFAFYVPFESELIDRRVLKASFGQTCVYAETPQELNYACAYLQQFFGAPTPAVGIPAPAPAPAPIPSPVTQAYAPAPAPAPAPAQQITQTAARVVQAPAPAPQAPPKQSILPSVLLMIGGAIATHYMNKLGE
jgi:hypothetical protein